MTAALTPYPIRRRVDERSGRSIRDEERLVLGRGAVFSLGRAAELLPINDKEARAWLVEEGLVVHLCGREVVVWADVLERLQRRPPDSDDGLSTRRRPSRRSGASTLGRVKLD